jgi:regulatory protein
MSFSDKPPDSRAPRAPRQARARISLKMQAIGFLSRREHSRQELRAKLLDSLRKRAREEAALAAATERAAQAQADALQDPPSNGIDDAFAPPPTTAPVASRTRRKEALRPPVDVDAAAPPPARRAALDTLSFADGMPLPSPLRASLVATTPGPGASPAPGPTTRSTHPADSGRGQDAAFDLDDAFADPAYRDPPAAPVAPTDLERTDPEAAVDQLLDWLVANKYLSETRFVESRVNARARKQGTLLIKLELSRHGLALEPEQAAALRETEFARAQALWLRKFGEPAPDARLRARQARFLAARGFAADIVRRVVGGEEEF